MVLRIQVGCTCTQVICAFWASPWTCNTTEEPCGNRHHGFVFSGVDKTPSSSRLLVEQWHLQDHMGKSGHCQVPKQVTGSVPSSHLDAFLCSLNLGSLPTVTVVVEMYNKWIWGLRSLQRRKYFFNRRLSIFCVELSLAGGFM